MLIINEQEKCVHDLILALTFFAAQTYKRSRFLFQKKVEFLLKLKVFFSLEFFLASFWYKIKSIFRQYMTFIITLYLTFTIWWLTVSLTIMPDPYFYISLKGGCCKTVLPVEEQTCIFSTKVVSQQRKMSFKWSKV